MNFYIAAIVLFLFLIVIFRKTMLKTAPMFLIVFILISGAFVYDNLFGSQPASAVNQIKSWLSEPAEKASSFLGHNTAVIKIKEETIIDAPAVNQFPELPRGCEVTSLSMLLQHAGIQADKMTLAKEIKKNPEPYRIENGKIYFGHPNDGFIGDMYSFDNPGLGVYHKPVKELAEKYMPGSIEDLTGSDFEELKIHLSDSRPVWVIINTAYKQLSDDFFQTWHTPSGKIQVTYKEHSVLLTGYDQEYMYFNDPLTGEKNKKAPITDFEKAWVQMGKQAITYLP
ncbi:C39 family peptidase [Cytobacillus oceanisediminis]|uniref:C39 family peptidase n=1 Tax=Cytobacillus oceanisediminis TaxID=665099 RepID=UPI001FB1D988|nr:C39 family peptidase [Cytobacillus oceanisediminis]UOE54762.1 C39 family peptidase [Cytobacillus oceanisediminis]